MKRSMQSVILVLLVLFGTGAWALPLDLITFNAYPGVSETGGVISFTEQDSLSAIYFYNDSLTIPTNAGDLTYNYSFTLGDQNDDYLVAVIDYINYVMEIGITGTALWTIDLRSYQGKTISLAFGIESSGPDVGSAATATISDLDLSVAAAEPSSLLLLCGGLMGLLYLRRR